jgi:hypothetical protein
LRVAAGTATGTAGADERSIANVSEPPATTRSAARAIRRCELPLDAGLDAGGGITGAAAGGANSGTASRSNSIADEPGVSIDASKSSEAATAAA